MSLRFLICKMELANTLYHRGLRRRLLLLSVKIRLLPCFLCPLGMTCTTVLYFRIYILSLTSLLLSSSSSNPSIWPVSPHTHLSQPLTSLSSLYVSYVFLSTDPWLLPELLWRLLKNSRRQLGLLSLYFYIVVKGTFSQRKSHQISSLNSPNFKPFCFLFVHRFILNSYLISPYLSLITHSSLHLSLFLNLLALWILQTCHTPYCFGSFVFPLIRMFLLLRNPLLFTDLPESVFLDLTVCVGFLSFLYVFLEPCYCSCTALLSIHNFNLWSFD